LRGKVIAGEVQLHLRPNCWAEISTLASSELAEKKIRRMADDLEARDKYG